MEYNYSGWDSHKEAQSHIKKMVKVGWTVMSVMPVLDQESHKGVSHCVLMWRLNSEVLNAEQ